MFGSLSGRFRGVRAALAEDAISGPAVRWVRRVAAAALRLRSPRAAARAAGRRTTVPGQLLIAKARRDLGYEPLPPRRADRMPAVLREFCFEQMKNEAREWKRRHSQAVARII